MMGRLRLPEASHSGLPPKSRAQTQPGVADRKSRVLLMAPSGPETKSPLGTERPPWAPKVEAAQPKSRGFRKAQPQGHALALLPPRARTAAARGTPASELGGRVLCQTSPVEPSGPDGSRGGVCSVDSRWALITDPGSSCGCPVNIHPTLQSQLRGAPSPPAALHSCCGERGPSRRSWGPTAPAGQCKTLDKVSWQSAGGRRVPGCPLGAGVQRGHVSGRRQLPEAAVGAEPALPHLGALRGEGAPCSP